MKKAQSSDVMVMLVGSVFAVALLIIIYAFVAGINPPFYGFEITKNLVAQAAKDKTGLCFGAEKVPFQQGEGIVVQKFLDSATISAHPFGPIECSAGSCKVISDVQTAVSAQCDYNAVTSAITCDIYFGKKDCTP